MSGIKDPFEILADEITLIRRQVDHLQRTSLDKEEAEDFNTAIIEFLDKLAHVPKNLHQAMQRDLAQTALDVRAHAVEAAQSAAREAIEKSHAESLKAAKILSQAAGEARRQAWRYFGGFWVWLASIGATGALIGALAVFWLQGRADAQSSGNTLASIAPPQADRSSPMPRVAGSAPSGSIRQLSRRGADPHRWRCASCLLCRTRTISSRSP